ncbi:MAG: glycoside hydrolase family 95 protein [Bacteroidales bacterium]|nr:glycoside hydrolase family 95 protein [Bacteroidales bacterium]
MKKSILLIMLLLTQLAVAQNRQNTLWYKQPANDWNEALPVGNGRIGAMVFGQPWHETIQLNEESLWAGSKAPGDADATAHLPEIQQKLIDGEVAEAIALSEKYLQSNPMRIRSYQSFGLLDIEMTSPTANKLTDYERNLHLPSGVATTTFTQGDVRFTREVFASAPDNLLVIRIAADKPRQLNLKLSYSRQQDAVAMPTADNMLSIAGQIIDLPSPQTDKAGAHEKFGGLVKGVNKGGTLLAVNNSIWVSEADEVVFYVTMNTDYNFEKLNFDRNISPTDLCRQQIDKLKSRDYNDVKARHTADHESLFGRVSLTLGDPQCNDLPTDERLRAVKEGAIDPALVALYFQYGRYMLMDSSRHPGVLPANLQGIWCQDMNAAWNSDFHTNINIQMNYWPAEVCNLSETVQPFSDWIDKLREPGRVTARKTYNARGWTVNHVSNPFGHTAISDGVGWGTFPIAGAWLVLHQWEHYLFTADTDYLRTTAYPCMKEAAEFLLSFMIDDKEGHLVTAPSNSPENTYRLPDGQTFKLTYGATMDVEIITELFEACLKAGKVLKTDADFGKQIRQALKKLPPIKIGKRYNTIQEWIEDYEEVEPGHRHVSHLFGLYPGTLITPARKQLFEAAKRTIERRRKYNEDPKTRQGSYTGWSRAWMINFYARLLDGEEAGANVQALLGKSTQWNLFDSHPPFQIDGNFGGAAGIAEMMLQSHAGELHLLPAIPSAWSHGDVSGLRARGGFTVDMKWADGKLTEAIIHANRQQKCAVRYNGQVKQIRVDAAKPYKIRFD